MENKNDNFKEKFLNYSPDEFPNGALVTNDSKIIVYVNSYFTTELLWKVDNIVGKNIDILLTKPSCIFFQSYIVPTLSHEKMCEEMQLTIFNARGIRIPITVNAAVGEDGYVYWSFFNSSKRDQLYDELIKARERLIETTDELKLLASIDDLTGLLNRREMKYQSNLALKDVLSEQHLAGLLILDIDHFKKINDTYGHLEGDRVLKKLGQLLISQSEKTDLVSRFGGEEFLIFRPNTNKDDMLLFCKKLHVLMADIVVGTISLKGSIGVSFFSERMTFDDVFTQADSALYNAKELGRNRTEIYSNN
jgi:diguanylate cyclase (GGDEF)-like protein